MPRRRTPARRPCHFKARRTSPAPARALALSLLLSAGMALHAHAQGTTPAPGGATPAAGTGAANGTTTVTTTTTTNGTAAATPPPISAADQALLDALNAAIKEADAAIGQTDTNFKDATTVQQSLTSDANTINSTSQSLTSRLNAVRTLGMDTDLGRVADLKSKLQNEIADVSALNKAKADLTAAASTDAKNSANTDVKAALTKAQGSGGEVQARLDAIKNLVGDATVVGSLDQAVQKAAQAVKSLATAAGAAIEGNGALTAAADPGSDRDALSQNMAALTDLLAARVRFRNYWNNTLKTAFTSAKANSTDLPADADLQPGKNETAAAKGLAARFGNLTKTPVANVADPAALSTLVGKVAQEIRASETDNADVQQAPGVYTSAQTAANQLRRIVSAWPALYAAWTQDDSADQTALSQADAALSAHAPDMALIADAANALNEALAGDMNHFVSDQVRLFYFPDVQRLMQALNPNVQQVTQGNQQQTADQARQDLVSAEANVQQSEGAVLDAKSRLRTIQADLAQAAAATAAAQRAAAAKHAVVNQLLAQQTAAATPGTQAATDALQAQIDASKTEATAADQSVTTAQQHEADVRTESTALPQRLLDAQSALSSAQQTLDKQRIFAAEQAQLEVEAFAAARDNAPYFRSNARVLSTDPARRVILLGYPDSQTIFLRGLPKDVEAVKDLIAEFDRPAPQARITLWTIQVNGTDPEKLADTMQNIDQHLLLTRTLTGTVQDRLRDSISFVVSQVAHNATSLYSLPDDDSKDRLRRYQFYQPEILRRLGYTLLPASDPLAQARRELSVGLDRLDWDMKDTTVTSTTLSHDADALVHAASVVQTLQTNLVGLSSHTPSANLSVAVQKLKDAHDSHNRAALQSDMATVRITLKAALAAFDALTNAPLAPSPDGLLDLADDDAYVTRFTLPDPAHATTLGEMLFVLSLAKKEYREAVLTHFLLSLESIPSNLPGFGSHHDDLSRQHDRLNQFTQGLGVIIRRALWNANNGVSDDSISADFQQRMMLSSNEKLMIEAALRKLKSQLPGDAKSNVFDERSNQDSFFPRFPATILGSFTDFDPNHYSENDQELTANQNEILLAVQAQARENVANEIKNLLRRIDALPTLPNDLRKEPLGHQLRMQYLPLVGFLSAKYYSAQGSNDSLSWLQRGLLATGALDKTSPEALKPLRLDECEQQVTALEHETAPPFSAIKSNDGKTIDWEDVDRQAWQIASLSGQHNSLSLATPRVAAADDMIKRLIITIEDDLDYFFIQPELDAIRQETARRGLELGTFNRESMLATNRRVARIDPTGSADIGLTGSVDFLQEATQLGQIYDRFRQEQGNDKATAAISGAAGGIASAMGKTVGTSLGVGAAFSLLGDLLTTPPPVGEIYSINSGNLFKVTPIFDPSGQALRFQFDYAGTTNVREPDGTTNAAIPRIERHTVDTDVQLTNLELREVSRFEANNALGTPEQTTGGIPILKHLPFLKDIPLIGYFAKSNKKGASRQESLIFAQTSMYPTVADIVDLLVDIPPLTVSDPNPPSYLEIGDKGGSGLTVKPANPATPGAE